MSLLEINKKNYPHKKINQNVSEDLPHIFATLKDRQMKAFIMSRYEGLQLGNLHNIPQFLV